MTLGETLSAGLVLQSIGIVALTSAKGAAPAEPAPNKTAPFTAADQSRQELRKAHSVQLISKPDEGDSIFKVPAGIYGFTFAPGTESPVFATHCYQSFEVHKAVDGTPYLIGFVSNTDVEAARQCESGAHVKLYPDAYGNATEIVALPADRIRPKNHLPNRDGGGWIELRIA